MRQPQSRYPILLLFYCAATGCMIQIDRDCVPSETEWIGFQFYCPSAKGRYVTSSSIYRKFADVCDVVLALVSVTLLSKEVDNCKPYKLCGKRINYWCACKLSLCAIRCAATYTRQKGLMGADRKQQNVLRSGVPFPQLTIASQ